MGNLYNARDHLGNLRELTDGSNVVRARYEYDPYGRRTKVSWDLEADWGFTGHYFHFPSGLHLAWFRAYDAHLGSWISRDPIQEGDGPNMYAYVGNNPLSWIDLSGLAKISVPGSGDWETPKEGDKQHVEPVPEAHPLAEDEPEMLEVALAPAAGERVRRRVLVGQSWWGAILRARLRTHEAVANVAGGYQRTSLQ